MSLNELKEELWSHRDNLIEMNLPVTDDLNEKIKLLSRLMTGSELKESLDRHGIKRRQNRSSGPVWRAYIDRQCESNVDYEPDPPDSL